MLCWPVGATLWAGASKKGLGADAELGGSEAGAAAFLGGIGVTCSAIGVRGVEREAQDVHCE